MVHKPIYNNVAKPPSPSLRQGTYEERFRNIEAWLQLPQLEEDHLLNVHTADLQTPGHAGQIVFDAEAKTVHVYTGTEWKQLAWTP